MTTKHIALLATGDEIVDGVILNTNAQHIANTLFHEHMHVTEHRIVRDNEANITQTILSLLENNDAIIITGGLGPTTDDRTRFALAKALQQPLELHEDVWQAIIDLLAQRYGMTNIPISNQQQALFPKNAEILANPNGTAAGCFCQFQNKLIFMLPGPPSECLPMFAHYVLPKLKEQQFGQKTYFKNWLLFGVSEGHIAEKLEAALASFPSCRTGYRVTFPYLEFKLFASNDHDLQQSILAISDIIAPHLFDDTATKASETLKAALLKNSIFIDFTDTATGGHLEQLLRTPELNSQLHFNTQHKNHWHLELSGLTEYWGSIPDAKQATLHLSLTSPKGDVYQETKVSLNYRQRNLHYAAEYACQFLLNHIHIIIA